jgi:ArsR family transcriptional regulator
MAIDCVEFCKALADETRQGILSLLQAQGELCVTDIVSAFNVAQPTISHHLNVLKNVGLVTSRKEGKQIYYGINQDNVSVCCGMLMVKFVPEPEKIVAELTTN